MKHKKLILFDLDGVLLDSKQNMHIAWQTVCDDHNIDIPFSKYFANIGKPFKDILYELGIDFNQDQIEQTFHNTSLSLLDKVKFYANVEKVLVNLISHQKKIGIVTSKDGYRTHKIIEKLPVSFSVIETPNKLLKGKPAPDHIISAVNQMNVTKDETIYIGDMNVDYLAARNAGVDFIHAAWGYGSCLSNSVLQLQDIQELQETLL